MSDEVRIVNEQTGGMKGQKLARTDMIPPAQLLELAEHYGKGEAKYPSTNGIANWTRGYDWSLSYGALLRHALQFWNGEDIDPETGSKHVIAVAWHAFALSQFMDTHPELDNRPRGNNAQWDNHVPDGFDGGVYDQNVAAPGAPPVWACVMCGNTRTFCTCEPDPFTPHSSSAAPGGGDYVGPRDPWVADYGGQQPPDWVFGEFAKRFRFNELRGKGYTIDETLRIMREQDEPPAVSKTAGQMLRDVELREAARHHLAEPGNGDRHLTPPVVQDVQWLTVKRPGHPDTKWSRPYMGNTDPPAQ